MSQLFISYAKEDNAVAVAISEGLGQRGFGVWYYERENVPGPSYLKRVSKALKQCEAVVLILSPISLGSRWVDVEVSRAFQSGKMFVPILHGVTNEEFEEQRLDWALALGSATTVSLPPAGVPAIIGLLERGIKELGISPAFAPPPPEPAEPEVADEVSPGADSDEVEFTIFGSREHAAGDYSLFQLWLHTAERYSDVERMAKAADASALPLAGKVVERALVRGKPLRLSLKVGEFRVEPSERWKLSWDGEPEPFHFTVAIPDEKPPGQLGKATLFSDAVAVASLTFQVPVKDEKATTQATAPPQAPLQRRIERAYFSYASVDRAEVFKRAQILSIAGIKVFVDTLDLEPGEKWSEQLRRKIDEADAFFLFWSEAARESEWVAREVEYVLARQRADPDHAPRIIPIALSVPMPPPPPALAMLHFGDTWSYLIAAESARQP